MVVGEKSHRLAVSETFRQTRLAQTTLPHSKSLKPPFFWYNVAKPANFYCPWSATNGAKTLTPTDKYLSYSKFGTLAVATSLEQQGKKDWETL